MIGRRLSERQTLLIQAAFQGSLRILELGHEKLFHVFGALCDRRAKHRAPLGKKHAHKTKQKTYTLNKKRLSRGFPNKTKGLQTHFYFKKGAFYESSCRGHTPPRSTEFGSHGK